MQDRVARLRKAAHSLHLRLLWPEYSMQERAPCRALCRLRTGLVCPPPSTATRFGSIGATTCSTVASSTCDKEFLWREWRHQDDAGRITRLRALRLASLADRHLLVQCVTITPENYSGTVSIDATLTGPVAQVTSSGTTVAMAVARRVTDPAGPLDPLN